MVATSPSATAELESVTTTERWLEFEVLVDTPHARIARAALTHPTTERDRCDAQSTACDELDPRFSTATTALIPPRGGKRFLLLFPEFGAASALAGEPRLLLDVELDGKHQLLELDLSRERSFRLSRWGIGRGLRYRPPGLLTEHFGHEVSAELGVDRWLGTTRLRLAAELGLAGCRGAAPEGARCPKDGLLLPLGLGLHATNFLQLGSALTLGIGLGYEGVAVIGRYRPDPKQVRVFVGNGTLTERTDRGPGAYTFLHGPRLSLLLAPSAPKVPRFPSGPPNTQLGLELSLELLGREAFEQPVLLPAIGYSFSLGL